MENEHHDQKGDHDQKRHEHHHEHHEHHHKHHEHHHKLVLTVVVGGTATEVEANPEAPINSIIPIALKQTGNEGQPPENWQLKDTQGTILDINKKIEDFHFSCDVKLFLSLKAGVGGNRGSSR
jgi:ABC-type Zn2+ transport system substrate-binding protein/surface adhesin